MAVRESLSGACGGLSLPLICAGFLTHVVAVFALDPPFGFLPPFLDLHLSPFPPSWIVQGSDTAENQKKTRMEGAVSLDA